MPSRVLAILVIPLLVGVALAGCVGEGDPGPVAEPEDPGTGGPDGGETFGEDEDPTDPAPATDACGRPLSTEDAEEPENDTTTPALRLEPVLTDMNRPLGLEHAGDCSDRLFIVGKTGLIQVWANGSLLQDPFLDLTDRVTWGGEQGLLGLAFSPEYAETGHAFVTYTAHNGDVVLERFTVDAEDANRLDPESGTVLLRVPQPEVNHNGGEVAFGPDGYLYMSLGDGGGAGDPHGNAQDPSTLLGAILRLDVLTDDPDGYAIPPDNPFTDDPDAADEVWAYGFRNPWRFSFDRETGDLWIADVGQSAIEEVNVEPAGSGGGRNYGWPAWEGSERFRGDVDVNGDVVFPATETRHGEDGTCAVIGGYVYRGNAIPDLRGTYVFTDLCRSELWGLTPDGEEWTTEFLLDFEGTPASLGEDEAGELYVLAHDEGIIYRVVADEGA